MKAHLFESEPSEVSRLILVRHGRTAANTDQRLGSRSDISLDETGQKQAALAAQRVKEYPVAAVYSSPQLRTRQTAEYIARSFNLEIQICDELNEFYFGQIANMRLDEIQTQYPDIHTIIHAWLNRDIDDKSPRPDFPGAETMDAFVTRVMRFQEMILEKHPGECVAAVTHLGVIKALLTEMAGGDMRYNRSAFLIDNASVSVVDFYRRYPVIRLVNDISHLHEPLRYGKIVLL
jgi:probable phosphoglycerate mutase